MTDFIFTAKTDSSAKNYAVTFYCNEFSSDYKSKSKRIIKDFLGNYTECVQFLKEYATNASKYDFKNHKTIEILDNEILEKKCFNNFDALPTKYYLGLSHKQASVKIKNFDNCVIASCTTSRAIFRLLTENDNLNNVEICKMTGLSKSDVSNIKNGIRHFDLERAAKIANDLGLLNEFTKILNDEYQNMINRMLISNTQKVVLKSGYV
jgi:hypothetical protein